MPKRKAAARIMARFQPPALNEKPDDSTRFILINTSHPGNVGATARAMKVMGFRELVLVAPRFPDVLCHEESVAMASGAADILARAAWWAAWPRRWRRGLCLRHRDDATRLWSACLPPARAVCRPGRPGAGAPASALVFGSGRYGMSNEGRLPLPRGASHPDAPRLRLAQPRPGRAVAGL